MRKSTFTESQIMSVPAEGEADISVSELKRVKKLESKNVRLKWLYAELALKNAAIKQSSTYCPKVAPPPPSARRSGSRCRSTVFRSRVLARP